MKKHRGGTSETTAWVKATKFRVPGVSPAAGKVIMMVLADYVDSDGATWLGAKALAEMADVSERVVRRFISAAVEEKWICTEATKNPSGRGRGLDRLFVHVEGEALFCNCALAHDQRAKLACEKPATNLPPETDQPATQGQNARGTPLIPEPAKEPARNDSALSARTKPKVTDSDPLKRAAHALATRAFELDPKPVLRENGKSAFPAVMAIFERLLKAGTPVGAIRAALDGGFVTVWTVNGIQTALSQSSKRRAGRSVDPVGDHNRLEFDDQGRLVQ